MSEYKLIEEIVQRSQSKIWDYAKLEWTLHQIFEADEPETCLCGHFPIIETCILQNKLNAHVATVGNCCVKKFIGLPSDLIFQAVKRVKADNQKSLNLDAIQYAYDKGWINKWEYDFSVSTIRKRNMTAKQMATRMKVNEKMLSNMRKNNTNII